MTEQSHSARKPTAGTGGAAKPDGRISAVPTLFPGRPQLSKLAELKGVLDGRAPPRSATARPVSPAPAPFAPATPAGQPVAQLYTLGHGGSKVSETARYITDGSGHVDALPGSNVDMSHLQGLSPRGGGYRRWVPQFDLIEDCVAAMEEVMHGEKLKYGVPNASKYRDLTPSKPFGESDAKNRKRGRDTDLGHDANPGRGEAYLIARQGHARDQPRPQFHGATVVAQDGSDNVTLEATAPPSGSISATRVPGVYDMYGTAKRRKKQTFKTEYQAEYGTDATVSVLKRAKKLPKNAFAPARSRKVIDY